MRSAHVMHGLPEGADALYLAARALDAQRAGQMAVHIALDDARMATLCELLEFFAPELEVLTLPAWDCLPYDRVSPNQEIVGRRVATLSALAARAGSDIRKPLLLLTSVNAVTQRLMPHSALAHDDLEVRAGKRLNEAKFISALNAQGYVRTDMVRETGEYAVRGGIIDVFPPAQATPLRIDLFGDDVESLKNFDPITQRSLDTVESFSLQGVAELVLTEQTIASFRARYRELFGIVKDDALYEAVSEGRRYAGMEHWLPLFYQNLDTIFDYVGDAFLSCDAQADQARREREAQITDVYQARQTLLKGQKSAKTKMQGAAYHPVPVDTMYLDNVAWHSALAKLKQPLLTLSPFNAADGTPDAGGKRARDFVDIRAQVDNDLFGVVRSHIATHQVQKQITLLAAYSTGSRDRLMALLNPTDLACVACDTLGDVRALRPHQVGVMIMALEHGFVFDRYAVITEQDILGDRLTRRNKQGRRKADAFLREVSSLTAGDLVVHADHGIGRFDGLETVSALGAMHDCLRLVYAGGDRLFVPVENIDMLSKFGSEEGGEAELDKLGGAGWQARKARVKKDLLILAGKLLEIAAAREVRKAEQYDVALTPYQAFCARFPYHETDDQQRSIDEVLTDLMRGRPMDRLVCGDVGFGKTEVAMRAAFVAALNGAQVAVAVPTTLLARQHFENFTRRFTGFPVRVAQLSRFVTAAESKRVKDGLADGSVNIVVGTHGLFADKIAFKNLGLVIVDEEQHFGVKQKERLKELRKDVHVLTLSATPIPRTLQLALTGVRDLSLITTPPVDRLAVRSFVMPFDPLVVREAILREHYRGGQSFFVCPRIKDLEEMEQVIRTLVPEVKIVTAHGQLPPSELEARMTAFYDRDYEVLMATNIIESGLDVPTANTLIVYHADLFGLSQLYQIRGRVGRSKTRAYAYMTYGADTLLTQTAQKRLDVIGMLDSLGSGFQLASHDMDIRGAGNLLGEQQSGHVKEVGIELYQQMLEEAVAAAREGVGFGGEALPDTGWSPQIGIGASVLIPENYVQDLNVRLSLYRRLAAMTETTDIDAFAAELIDRFGAYPAEVDYLMQLIAIKALCKKAGVEKLDAGPKGVVVAFRNSTPPKPQNIVNMIAHKVGTVKFRPDHTLFYARVLDGVPHRFQAARGIADELARLAG